MLLNERRNQITTTQRKDAVYVLYSHNRNFLPTSGKAKQFASYWLETFADKPVSGNQVIKWMSQKFANMYTKEEIEKAVMDLLRLYTRPEKKNLITIVSI